VRPIHSDELTGRELASMRAVFEASFTEDEPFTEEDFAHTMGGMHFVIELEGEIVSHASVVERHLHTGGHRLSTGYVEGVATLPGYQRRRFAAAIMERVGEHIDRTFELGALGTGLIDFYERFGWVMWRGRRPFEPIAASSRRPRRTTPSSCALPRPRPSWIPRRR
jgi:aminoglycoside 2'-N-acetyltransferase I